MNSRTVRIVEESLDRCSHMYGHVTEKLEGLLNYCLLQKKRVKWYILCLHPFQISAYGSGGATEAAIAV